MQAIKLQMVKIKALLRENSAYDPIGINERAPRVGDTGTVVDVQVRSGGQPEYTVECGRPDGTCAWIADFVEEELEATDVEASRTETESARLPPRPVRDHKCGTPVDERVQSDWRQYTAVGATVLFFFVLIVAAAGLFFALFFVWPPGSVAGAGFRAAAVVVVFVALSSRLTGEGISEALITATIVGICFFLIGAAGWYAWTAA
jgi:hypothetical protein